MSGNSFEHKVAEYITAHRLLRDDDSTVIVALSGGADSVALLSALHNLGYNTAAAHCNFHLRGAESMRDMHHAADIARRLDVTLHVKDFDVPARMQTTGESLEMACRSLRYEWFLNLLEREHAQAVAVGHHLEDQAETFLLNALRGSGITGLAGMLPANHHIVRPLLECSRREIEQYLSCRRLSFVTDSSNADNSFRRNSLRNEVLPAMGRQFPKAVEQLAATTQKVAGNLSLYNYAVAELARRFRPDGDNTINIKSLYAAMPAEAGRTLLFEMLRPMGFNMTHATNIIKAMRTSETAVFRSTSGYDAELCRGILTLHLAAAAIPATEYPVTLTHDIATPVHISVERQPIRTFMPERDPDTIYLDASVLDGHSLCIRPWRRGDRIRPFGMKGTKLVSDIMTEAHLTPSEKGQIWLLTCDEEILWVIGLRASRHFSVSPSTRNYLRLTLIRDIHR